MPVSQGRLWMYWLSNTGMDRFELTFLEGRASVKYLHTET